MRCLPICSTIILAMLMPSPALRADAMAQSAAGNRPDSYVPAYLLKLPTSVQDVFVADTANATIYRFEQSADGIVLGSQGYVSIGQNGAGKQRAWDRKTPLGIYFVVDQIDTRRLHEKYGITAYPLDYPNAWDRRLQRSGYGIWVHGVLVGGGPRPARDTDGCLALPNEDLRLLQNKFVPLTTPVIISHEILWRAPAAQKALSDELEKAVDRWREAQSENDLHAYLSMYANEFRYRGLTLAEYASLRAETLQREDAVDVTVEELLLLADPQEDGLYLSRFQQRIDNGQSQSTTTKRLYWQRDDSGRLKIVAEDNG